MTSLSLKSDFAILDVKAGGGELLKAISKNQKITVTVIGTVDTAWGPHDGTSQEFSINVQSVEAVAA